MPDVALRLPAEVADRLAVLAAARDMSMLAVIEGFVSSTSTLKERREAAERARESMAEHFGYCVSNEESTHMGRRMQAVAARHQAQTDHL
ncbi:hypothetical protein ACWD3Z_40775 [Streptomyces sp. NPDC002740]